MKKVYLSKSKQANPTDIAEARQHFSEHNEVVEFNGGQYDDSILDNVDILCIIPPGQNEITDIEEFYEIGIGKGSFTELVNYTNRVPKDDREVYVFKNSTIYSVHKAKVIEENWTNMWAILTLKK